MQRRTLVLVQTFTHINCVLKNKKVQIFGAICLSTDNNLPAEETVLRISVDLSSTVKRQW